MATNLLSAKDVPYIVAAPLLIQDLVGWRRDGVQGLQQVCMAFVVVVVRLVLAWMVVR